MNRIWSFTVMLLLALSYATPARADLLSDCLGDVNATGALVSGIVGCVYMAITSNTNVFLAQFSLYMQPVAGAVLLLAIIVFGIHMMSEDKHITARALGTLVRLSLVAVYSLNLGGLANVPFIIVTDLVTLVAGGPPWGQVDSAIMTLFGYGPSLALYNGVLGILGAGLFSSSSGIFLFFIGFAVILSLLYLILRAIYTYLLAIVMIAFLVIISPLVILPAAFRSQERYFRSWLQLMIAAILQPMLLFAFLNMFFSLVIVMVGRIFGVLGGNDFSAYYRNNNPLFSWRMMTDPDLLKSYQSQGLPQGTPTEQGFMNPMMQSTTETNFMQLSMFDLGLSPAGQASWQLFINQFIGLGIVCMVMIALLDLIPQLADSIAGVPSRIGFERIPLFDNLKQAMQTALRQGGGK